MKKRFVVLFEIFLIVIGLLYYTFKIMMPEYRNQKGSSDQYIKSDLYSNMIEIQIDGETDFALVLNQEGTIYHLFFFDNSSVFLYNKNIENKNIEDGLSIMIPILIEKQILHDNSSVVLYRDKDSFYDVFKTNWEKSLLKYSIQVDTSHQIRTIEEKANTFNINTDSFSSMLFEMDFYSKEMVKNFEEEENIVLNNGNAKTFADRVYQKIESVVSDKQIQNINRENVEIDISLIPADRQMKYYPTHNSWYYVTNGKVYAYIEFIDHDQKYAYCYQGSIDIRTEGECKS